MITKEQLLKLVGLCLDINGTGARDRDMTGDKPTVFFEFNAHVGYMEVKAYEHGWSIGIDPEGDFGFYTDGTHGIYTSSYEETIAYLEQLREKVTDKAGT